MVRIRSAPTAFAECFTPGLARSVGRRELEQLASELGWAAEQLREGACRQNEGPGNAFMATLAHEHVCEVFSAFGERGLSAEAVAGKLAREVRAYQSSEAALGPYLADQWALPLALAVWQSGSAASYTCTELTPHARTNFEVIAKFLPVEFEESPREGLQNESRWRPLRHSAVIPELSALFGSRSAFERLQNGRV